MIQRAVESSQRRPCTEDPFAPTISGMKRVLPICSLVWFRQDLRLSDNPALLAAARRGAVVPVFIWAPSDEARWPLGAASRWWLHESLKRFDASLRQYGSRVVFRKGPTIQALCELARESGASAVYWNRRYEPAARRLEQQVESALRRQGIDSRSFNGSLLFDPAAIKSQSGKPYRVFSAFWKHCLAGLDPPPPEAAPGAIPRLRHWPTSLKLHALGLLPAHDSTRGIRECWEPGETAAWKKLTRFARELVEHYAAVRDLPHRQGTSRLSPHLQFGEISPRQIWFTVRADHRSRPLQEGVASYRMELGWREFAYHLLFHFPHTAQRPLRREFAAFPWRQNDRMLRAWQRGQTGFPIVDAGMRELWHTGWMHNRVRMIVASFLTKDLLIGWQKGAAWFWNTLVDADLANNTLGWQWTAGCGADAAPFFRIFNPVTQSERFNPDGTYIRRWVPELGRLPNEWIHQPWAAPQPILADAGVVIGTTYPKPIVDHAAARVRALAAYRSIA